MQDKEKKPLAVALHGMDERSRRTLDMFFQGPCKCAAAVVSASHAEADLIDMDSFRAQTTFEAQRSQYPDRPVIVLSLKDPGVGDAFYVKKPIKAPDMLAVIGRVRAALAARAGIARQPDTRSVVAVVEKTVERPKAVESTAARGAEAKTFEQMKSSKHRAAMQLDEKAFTAYIGAFASFDPQDPAQLAAAQYDAKGYLQSYLQSAVKVALSKNRILQLNTGWKPIVIFPHSREVWVDADDKQLRSVCAVPLHTLNDFNIDGTEGKVTVTPANADESAEARDPEKFQSLDAFLWKVALWTSKGRVPAGIDVNRPVHLKRWPNFTRLLLTPNALRITAYLVHRPCSLMDVAELLNIRHQYVFALFSAAHAIGLAGQSVRQVDSLVAPSPVEKKDRSGLLGKILDRLRGK